ncbi:MAG: chemotaxis-specific protein-glutamate methyltransferase CheB [Rhodospirillaceae bacterium]
MRSTKKKVRVLIVEDSLVVRTALEYIIERHPHLTLAGTATSAEQALAMLDDVAPDVISMDIRLPGMNGLEATRRIMSERPTPIVVISSAIEDESLNISMNALRAGALSVVEKPVGTTHDDYERIAKHICTQLYIMSEVRVVRQRFQTPAMARAFPAQIGMPALRAVSAGTEGPYQLLGLVASTGGPNALVKVLSALPADFPLPVCVVQHIGDDFVGGFALWLGSLLRLPVSLAEDGEVPRPGHVYVAPARHHLRVGRSMFHLGRDAQVSTQRPSGTVLFSSMAASYGARAIGVLLTGMGDDGAAGLLAMRQAGGFTIAEDASTAVVYGMPAVAVQYGAVMAELPLDAIGSRLLHLVDIPARMI